MNINLTFDSSTNNAPSAFFMAMNAVAQFLDNLFTNPITVNITVGYGKIQGQNLISGVLGESRTFFNQYSYSAIRGALISSASTSYQNQAASTLPASDPTNAAPTGLPPARPRRSAFRGQAPRPTALLVSPARASAGRSTPPTAGR